MPCKVFCVNLFLILIHEGKVPAKNVYVCVCVSEREKQREREKERQKEREIERNCVNRV